MISKDYRKLFEKLFNEVDSIQELLLKFDICHINYDDTDKFALAKYIFKLMRTFRHKSSLSVSFNEWLYANIDKITNIEKIRFWIENSIIDDRNCNNNRLNDTLVKMWLSKYGLKRITRN